MARLCGTCNHKNRSEIERALESGQSIRAVGARFGVSRSALQRHASHLLRATPPQTNEPVGPEERPAQSLDTADVVPAVLSPLTSMPEPLEPESPNRLTPLSGQPEPEAPSQPAVAQERPALLKNNSGRPGPCPVCGSNRWRQLDGHLTCDVCHPLPSPGTFVYTGRAVKELRGASTPMVSSVPSIRGPIALSGCESDSASKRSSGQLWGRG